METEVGKTYLFTPEEIEEIFILHTMLEAKVEFSDSEKEEIKKLHYKMSNREEDY